MSTVDSTAERLQHLHEAFTKVDRAEIADQLSGIVPAMLARLEGSEDFIIGFARGREDAAEFPDVEGIGDVIAGQALELEQQGLTVTTDEMFGYILGVYVERFEEGEL